MILQEHFHNFLEKYIISLKRSAIKIKKFVKRYESLALLFPPSIKLTKEINELRTFDGMG